MKIYELIIIFKPKNKIFILKFLNIFKNKLIYYKFTLFNLENWGLIKFNYKIKENNKGSFLFLRFSCENFLINKIKEYLRLNNIFILRYFILKLNKINHNLNIFYFKKRLKKKNEFKKNFKKKN
ncbi:30S ribosomal subunit protein S6 [Candidatus Nasuia deltocephalinicola str. NAS-ALF]|uniref:Small ribosomal subunit protein bS6 n=1 Tax=Candidatus Nasuia deltocephalinicola str. NAS-ALF TaxID=1343077 RepID=S5TE61_9PROT|nr:30S ribosomal subunit protein S6 [Candidatus Nasuia deltocephalinicola str. NAS-ALF]